MRRLEAKLDRIAGAVSTLGPISSAHKTSGETRVSIGATRTESTSVSAIPKSQNAVEDCGHVFPATNQKQLVGPAGSLRNKPGGQQTSGLERQGSEADIRLAGSLPAEKSAQSKARKSAAPADTENRVINLQLEGLDRTLALVAEAVGVNYLTGEAGDRDDRRRLKEKLKVAMETGQRLTVRQIDSEREMWMEYFFGICKPDGRVGKAGSK